MLLAFVAKPHANLLGKKVKFLGYRLDCLSVRARVLVEELLQGGLGLRCEHCSLLAFARGHHGHIGAARWDRLWEFGLLKPLLQDLFDGCRIGGTQLHLLETANGTLGKVTVTTSCQRLSDRALSVAKTDAFCFELLGKSLQLNVVRSHLGRRDGGEGPLGRDTSKGPGRLVEDGRRYDSLSCGRLGLRGVWRRRTIGTRQSHASHGSSECRKSSRSTLGTQNEWWWTRL